MNKVVCLNTGDKYKNNDYVGKLYRGLARNTTQPFEFECVTKTKYPGWWGKLEFFPTTERIVYIDLDTIVVGNCDFLFEYQGSFAICRDFYRMAGWNASVMAIGPNQGWTIRAQFDANAKKIMETVYSDQEWIQSTLSYQPDFWQDMNPWKVVSYKADGIMGGAPLGPSAALVCMHGDPKPHDLKPGDPLLEHWK
jgi:hypothetical protein